ncbi:MAG: UPF0280 family protein [Candidatus Omnitrophota bacterium]|nr:UPF0280 family protein [Candidatus Omnitrophota bacterium]
MYKDRIYRQWVRSDGLVTFEVKEVQTDLLISSDKNLEKQARASVLNYRKDIEEYVKKNSSFYTSLEPVRVSADAPAIVRAMAGAAEKAGVGPMAAIAGAMAEFVGRDLLSFSREVIVENGGDIFMKTKSARRVGIYAGETSPFTGKIAIEIQPDEKGVGVCTSSGTVSHSLNFGKADAVCIISENTALADAVATIAGNAVKGKDDIEKGITIAKSIDGVKGVLIAVQDKMGSWGNIKLVQ